MIVQPRKGDICSVPSGMEEVDAESIVELQPGIAVETLTPPKVIEGGCPPNDRVALIDQAPREGPRAMQSDASIIRRQRFAHCH
jgi:hypothetical protein